MAEKVIHEYKVIETDDGYRIEIKGDKERIRKWIEGNRRMGWRGRGFGPFGSGFPGMMFMKGHHGPGDFTIEIEEEDEEQEASKD
ncbi:MAG: hypothetical protein O6949_08445 [Chloroflexi bacterium]|nr:hypothetical protein [Chloroflexota bacterium]